MARAKQLYPYAEQLQNARPSAREEEPDFIGNAPNYDKFQGWSCEEVLVWLNID